MFDVKDADDDKIGVDIGGLGKGQAGDPAPWPPPQLSTFLKQHNLACSPAELMVVCLNLSEGQRALEAQLISHSTTTTLRTILYIELTLKSAYSTGHSDRLFSCKKSMSMLHRKRRNWSLLSTTTARLSEDVRMHPPASLTRLALSRVHGGPSVHLMQVTNMTFVVRWVLVAVFSYQCSDLKLHWEPVQVTNSVVKMDLEPSCG